MSNLERRTAAGIAALLRPKQWIKNSFLFAAIIFSGNFFDGGLLVKNMSATLIFCALSSAVYVMNDIADRERDRNHPKKCMRPLASGQVAVPAAVWLTVCLFLGSMVAAACVNWGFFACCLLYFALNMAYSMGLKNQPILDIMLIATGFVIRAVAGGVAIGVRVSNWLVICTTLLSLFIALSKRKGELDAMVKLGKPTESRKVLAHYTADMLNMMIVVAVSATLISYCVYVVSLDNVYMLFTIPCVIYGLFRYLYISYAPGNAAIETPEQLIIQDKPMLVDALLWVAVCIVSIYV